MHWGQVDYQLDEARIAFEAGTTAMAMLKIMDKERADAMDRVWRANMEQ